MRTQKFRRTLGIALFLLGLVSVSALTLLLTLPGLEGFYYFSQESQMAHEELRGLSCPRVLGADEQGTIRLRLENTHTRDVVTPVIIHVARPIEDFYGRIDPVLQPGEEGTYEWKVGVEDRIYGRMILANLTTYRTVISPARMGTCTIAVLPWRIPGAILFYGGTVMGLLVLAIGLGFWLRGLKPRKERRPFVMEGFLALACVAVLGLIASMFNLWVGGLAGLILSVLLSIVLAANLLQSIEG